MKQFTLIAALFVLFASFRTADTVKTDLYNNKWQLKTIYSKDGAAYIYTNAFIRFDEGKKQVGGNGSCNSFGGSVTIKDDQLKFGALFSTKMYCEAVQQIEDDFFAALGKVTRYEIKENCLLLYQGDKLLLEFGGVEG
jgi:heat shock protein HslJ